MTVEDRKQRPVYSGVIAYFPDALLEVAYCSFIGNQQHHKDKPLHWDKSKSSDEPDALVRHLIDHAKGEVELESGVRALAAVAWRALANLQREIEREREAEEREHQVGGALWVGRTFAPGDSFVIPLRVERCMSPCADASGTP